MGATCGSEQKTELENANETLEVQICALEARIVKMEREAAGWAAQVNTESTAKMRALQCLKKKRQFEQQRDRLLSTQSNIESAQFQQEQTNVAYKTANALRKGHDDMKLQQNKMNVNELENLMDDMQDRQAALRESQDILARSGATDGIMDVDFEAEFQALANQAAMENRAEQSYLDNEYATMAKPSRPNEILAHALPPPPPPPPQRARQGLTPPQQDRQAPVGRQRCLEVA